MESIDEFVPLGQRDSNTEYKAPDTEKGSFYLQRCCVFKVDAMTKLPGHCSVLQQKQPATSLGIALNKRLIDEPKLQFDIFETLLKLQLNAIAYSSEIASFHR